MGLFYRPAEISHRTQISVFPAKGCFFQACQGHTQDLSSLYWRLSSLKKNMSLWVDKYRPIELDQCEHVNAGVANHLKQLVKDGDCPHCASVCSVLLLLMVGISNRPCFVLLAFQKFLFLFFFNFAFVALLTQLFVTLTDVFSSSLYLLRSVILRSAGFWEEIARPRAFEHDFWPRRSQDESRTENVENRRDVDEKN